MNDMISKDKLLNGIYSENPKDVMKYIADFPSVQPSGDLISRIEKLHTIESTDGQEYYQAYDVLRTIKEYMETAEPNYDEVYHVGSKKFQIRADRYESNNNLALQVYCDGEPWACLSVNLDDELPPHQFYVDVNNWPGAVDFIKQFEIAKPLYYNGHIMEGVSGFCTYPLYELDRRFTKC